MLTGAAGEAIARIAFAVMFAATLVGCADATPLSAPDVDRASPTVEPSSGPPEPRPWDGKAQHAERKRYEALAEHTLDSSREDDPWTFEDVETQLEVVARGRIGEPVDAGDVKVIVHEVVDGPAASGGSVGPNMRWVVIDVQFVKERTVFISDRAFTITDGHEAFRNESWCSECGEALTADHSDGGFGVHRQPRSFLFPADRTPRYVLFATEDMSWEQQVAIIDLRP